VDKRARGKCPANLLGSMNVGRRRFITACAVLSASTGATGCLGRNGEGNGGGDGIDDGGEIPKPTEADYATWLFDPETAGREIEAHRINYREPASVPTAVRVGDNTHFDRYDRFIVVGGSNGASITDFASEETFRGMLNNRGVTDAEPVEERSRYEVYDVESGTFAVDRDEMVVIGSGYEGVVRTVLDTRIGDTASYTETNEDMRLLLETLGGGHVVEAGDGGFSEDAVAAGSMRNGNEDGTVDVRAAEIFPDEDTVDSDAFEDSLLTAFENGLSDDTLEIDDVHQDGRVVVAVGTSENGIRHRIPLA